VATKIFINYRREDTQATAGRIHDSLRQAFGRNNVFMDVDNIRAGEKFAERLNSRVEECDIFLSIIGPNWLDAREGEHAIRQGQSLRRAEKSF
jgi:TIR domain